MEPIFKDLPYLSPEVLASIVSQHAPSIWLDSALPQHSRSRFSILALNSVATLAISSLEQGVLKQGPSSQALLEPYQYLDQWLASLGPSLESQMVFCGGVLGFSTYELHASYVQAAPMASDTRMPPAFYMLVDTGIILDHHSKKAWCFSLGIEEDLKSINLDLARQRILQLEDLVLSYQVTAEKTFKLNSIHSNEDRSSYLSKVRTIKEGIFNGDCYQVNYSQKFTAIGNFDSATLYLQLRRLSPAPQMAFINLGDSQILSTSPETLLEIQGNRASSYPIKGTRPRSLDHAEDQKMAAELLDSKKDAAELLMITDLVRNDLGQFCKIGSIQVPHLKTLESFPEVHHLVSEVVGQIREEVGPFRALLEMSPGGSITGAPKLKAMEYINRLENRPRGMYTGTIGYAGFNRRSSFNIAIRTATLWGDTLEYAAGGGVVADSDPDSEYEESLHKAGAFLKALGVEGKFS